MDINIRKNDRIQLATIMDDGMALGTNLETGAMGTFHMDCFLLGSLCQDGDGSGGKSGDPVAFDLALSLTTPDTTGNTTISTGGSSHSNNNSSSSSSSANSIIITDTIADTALSYPSHHSETTSFPSLNCQTGQTSGSHYRRSSISTDNGTNVSNSNAYSKINTSADIKANTDTMSSLPLNGSETTNIPSSPQIIETTSAVFAFSPRSAVSTTHALEDIHLVQTLQPQDVYPSPRTTVSTTCSKDNTNGSSSAAPQTIETEASTQPPMFDSPNRSMVSSSHQHSSETIDSSSSISSENNDLFEEKTHPLSMPTSPRQLQKSPTGRPTSIHSESAAVQPPSVALARVASLPISPLTRSSSSCSTASSHSANSMFENSSFLPPPSPSRTTTVLLPRSTTVYSVTSSQSATSSHDSSHRQSPSPAVLQSPMSQDALGSRNIGRHVATCSYSAKSVLEASVNAGDEIEVIFWQDEEMAVGVHMATRREALFKESLLRYIGGGNGTEGIDTASASSSSIATDGECLEAIGASTKSEADTELTNEISDATSSTATTTSSVGGTSFLRKWFSSGTISKTSDSSKSRLGEDGNSGQDGQRSRILLNALAAQNTEEVKYKRYLENLGNKAKRVSVGPSAFLPPPRNSSSSSRQSLDKNLRTFGKPTVERLAELQSSEPQSAEPQSAEVQSAEVKSTEAQSTEVRSVEARSVEVSSPLVMHQTLSEEQKRSKAATFVIKELHETEESYKNSLKAFLDNVIEPIREAKILSKADIFMAFRHVAPLYEFSVKVEKYLRDAIDKKNGDAGFIADLFLRDIEREEWVVYENYMKNYRPIVQIMTNMASRQDEKGEQFRQFQRNIEKSALCERKTMDEFLMLPIQRITRYHLLLSSLKKACEPGSLTMESIGIAEGYMKNIGNTLQEVQAREEEMRKMFEIVNAVDNCPSSLISYSKRRLFAEFSVTDTRGVMFGFGLTPSASDSSSLSSDTSGFPDAFVWSGLSRWVSPGPGPRRLFLFSDTILIAAIRVMPSKSFLGTAPPNSKKMELVQKIDLNIVSVVEDFEDDDLILRPLGATSLDEVFAFKMPDLKSAMFIKRVLKEYNNKA